MAFLLSLRERSGAGRDCKCAGLLEIVRHAGPHPASPEGRGVSTQVLWVFCRRGPRGTRLRPNASVAVITLLARFGSAIISCCVSAAPFPFPLK